MWRVFFVFFFNGVGIKVCMRKEGLKVGRENKGNGLKLRKEEGTWPRARKAKRDLWIYERKQE